MKSGDYIVMFGLFLLVQCIVVWESLIWTMIYFALDGYTFPLDMSDVLHLVFWTSFPLIILTIGGYLKLKERKKGK